MKETKMTNGATLQGGSPHQDTDALVAHVATVLRQAGHSEDFITRVEKALQQADLSQDKNFLVAHVATVFRETDLGEDRDALSIYVASVVKDAVEGMDRSDIA